MRLRLIASAIALVVSIVETERMRSDAVSIMRHEMYDPINMIRNAAGKYVDRRTSIYVTSLKDGDWFCINIQNYGIPIADEEKDRIFEMWYRAPQAVKRSQDGLGLGLYHARQIVERHEGRIEVSTINRQTTITIRLPTFLAERIP